MYGLSAETKPVNKSTVAFIESASELDILLEARQGFTHSFLEVRNFTV
jgi:hypothetical protein